MGGGGTAALRGSCQALAQTLPCSAPNAGVLPRAKHTLLRALHGGHTGPPRREKVAARIPSWMGGVPSAHPPIQARHTPPKGKKGALDSRHAGIIENLRDGLKGGKMAVKAKRIKCARCGERETVMRGERGPASIYCDLCRDEVKREQAALRAQAYR